jgi:hypothetical protein
VANWPTRTGPDAPCSPGSSGWGATGTLLPVVGAALGYATFVAIEGRVTTPVMRPTTLARRPVLSGMFLMLVATGLLLGLFFLTSLYFQHVLGFSALKTGLVFLPVAIAITAGAQTAAHLPGARSLGDADDDDRRGGPVANAIRQHDQGDQRIFEWATGNPLHARFRASALPEYRASLR